MAFIITMIYIFFMMSFGFVREMALANLYDDDDKFKRLKDKAKQKFDKDYTSDLQRYEHNERVRYRKAKKENDINTIKVIEMFRKERKKLDFKLLAFFYIVTILYISPFVVRMF